MTVILGLEAKGKIFYIIFPKQNERYKI